MTLQLSNKKSMMLAIAILMSTATAASANDYVNNHASGYIGGGVDQRNFNGSPGYETPAMEANVGAIKADSANNNSASGAVTGNVQQQIAHAPGPLDTVPTLNVGTIKASHADGNYVYGMVGGNVQQEGRATADIGSITDNSNPAWVGSHAGMNATDGFVGGDITQVAPIDRAKLSVGSIGAR